MTRTSVISDVEHTSFFSENLYVKTYLAILIGLCLVVITPTTNFIIPLISTRFASCNRDPNRGMVRFILYC
jgi:hypothetical protein